MIRNFVSNALKFAPPASSVGVVAYFDPRPMPTPHPRGGLRGTSGHSSSSVVGASKSSSSSSHGDRGSHGWLSRQAARAHRRASWLLGTSAPVNDAGNGSLSDNGSLLTGTAGGGGWGRLVVAVTDEGPGRSEPFHGPCLA